MGEKLKSWLGNDYLYLGAVIIIVAAGSFALGRYSYVDTSPTALGNGGVAAVSMVYAIKASSTGQSSSSTEVVVSDQSDPEDMSPVTSATTVVASKKGTKYHVPSCPGAKQIKPENKITFDSEAAAQAAGYTRASNCKTFP